VEITDDSTELLERRLAERVEERVRSRLLAFYLTVGGIIFTVIGYFGYDVISSTRETASQLAERTIERASDSAKQAIAPAVERAERATDVAEEQTAAATAMLNVLTDWMAQRTQKLSDIEENVQSTMGKVESVAKQLQSRLDAVAGQIQSTEETLNSQRERASELFAGQGDLKQLADQLVKLSEEVKSLDSRFSETFDPMPSAGPVDSTSAPAVRDSATQAVIQAIIDDSGSIVTAENAQKPTVYVQFAGVERAVAAALSDALDRQNFTMPGQERTGVAAGLHEVRFFFEDDQAQAQRLVAATNDWLKANNYEADVVLRDSTNYGKAKPKPGVLELWIEPRPV
jgi:hypothetical protein